VTHNPSDRDPETASALPKARSQPWVRSNELFRFLKCYENGSAGLDGLNLTRRQEIYGRRNQSDVTERTTGGDPASPPDHPLFDLSDAIWTHCRRVNWAGNLAFAISILFRHSRDSSRFYFHSDADLSAIIFCEVNAGLLKSFLYIENG
jgi:hypothetical protein